MTYNIVGRFNGNAPVYDAASWNPGITAQAVKDGGGSKFYSILVPGLGICEYQGAYQPYSVSVPRPNAVRYEVHQGDQHTFDIATGSGSERSEMATRTDWAPVGQPGRYRELFTIEPGPVSTASWFVIAQAHQDLDAAGSPSPPPFAIGLEKGDFLSIWHRHVDANGKMVEVKAWQDTVPITRGVRVAFDVSYIFDAAGGRLIVKYNNNVVVDYRGPLGYPQMRAVYWAEGIYRHGPTPETIAITFEGRNHLVLDGF